jgi:hypothetical protein
VVGGMVDDERDYSSCVSLCVISVMVLVASL